MNTTFIFDPEQTEKLGRELDPEQTEQLTRETDPTQGLACSPETEQTEKLERKSVAEQAQKVERTVVMDVQNITRTLPLGREHIEILKGVSFQIMSGEFVSIVGPSGSGKSTLLGIIAGLDNPTSGKVLIDGVDITRMTEGKLAVVRNSKIGMVFQAFNLIHN